MTDPREICIPAALAASPYIGPQAKLLYGLLIAESGEDGYCILTKRDLAKRLSVSHQTASNAIGQLAAHGFVKIQLVKQRTGPPLRKLYPLPVPDVDK